MIYRALSPEESIVVNTREENVEEMMREIRANPHLVVGREAYRTGQQGAAEHVVLTPHGGQQQPHEGKDRE